VHAAWSSARYIYTLNNRTYGRDLFHYDLLNGGLFYTNSPYVQEVTYIGKGIQDNPTHLFLITMDGYMEDCTMMFRTEIGQNYSSTSPARHFCSKSNSLQPFTFNMTSVNIYSGDPPNPDHPIAPSVVIGYCSLGINIDNHNSITPTTNAFECLDQLTSKPLGTHFGLVQIGNDVSNFFDINDYSPSTISLANAVNNFAQIVNSVFLGAQDGSNNAINNIDDIRAKLTPEKINKTPDLVFEIVLGIYVSLMGTAVAALGPSAIAGEVVTAEVGAGVGAETDAVYVENEAIVAEENFGNELTSYAEEVEQEVGGLENEVPKINEYAEDHLNKAELSLSRNNLDGLYENLQKSKEAIEELKKLGALEENLEYRYFNIYWRSFDRFANAQVQMSPRMRGTTSAMELVQRALGSGSKFSPSALRGPWRPSEITPAEESPGNIKRDLLNNKIGGTIDLETISLKEVMYDLANNFSQSISIDDFKDQVKNVLSTISTELKNNIATDLNGSDISILDNFIKPKLGVTNDYGKSLTSTMAKDFLTARITSIVMTGFGAVICNNDVAHECEEYQCSCNTPIGDNNKTCIFAGGFGPNNAGTYYGYRDSHLNLIKQWNNVAGICQNVNGWQFNYDTCEGYYRHDKCKSACKGKNKRSTKYLSCAATQN
ncbi:3094_t:CDS:1, partial [Cetraspora pellucida]